MDQDPVDRTAEEAGQDSDVIAEKKHIMESPIQELINEHILVVREVSIYVQICGCIRSNISVLCFQTIMLSCYR